VRALSSKATNKKKNCTHASAGRVSSLVVACIDARLHSRITRAAGASCTHQVDLRDLVHHVEHAVRVRLEAQVEDEHAERDHDAHHDCAADERSVAAGASVCVLS
jgi:hypothetical protein